MKIDESKLLILVVCIILGILIASQISFGKFSPRQITSLQDYLEKTSKINKLKDEISILQEKEITLTENISKYSGTGQSEDKIMDELQEQSDEYDLFRGATAVEGPGIQITLSDSVEKVGDDEEREILETLGLVHDQDLYTMVAELKNAGAEAISINGERIINSSAMYCAGPVILINGDKYTPPYVIKAIGNPDDLAYSLDKEGSYYKELQDRDLQVSYIKESKMNIPAYNKSMSFTYAKRVGTN